MLRRFLLVLPLVFCLCLASCGFHLRGRMPLPATMRTISLEAVHPSRFTNALTARLKRYNIQVLSKQQAGIEHLVILDESNTKHLASSGASTQTRNYQLTYSVRYQLYDQHNKAITPPRQIKTYRSFSQNPNVILASDQIELRLQREMQRDMVTRLIDQLTVMTYYYEATPATVRTTHRK